MFPYCVPFEPVLGHLIMKKKEATSNRNRVSPRNLGEVAEVVAQTRFLGSPLESSETGFLSEIWVRLQR